jgi:hypothetical protein
MQGLISPKASVLNETRYLAPICNNHLILIASLFDCDHFCRKVVHGSTYIRSAAGTLFDCRSVVTYRSDTLLLRLLA